MEPYALTPYRSRLALIKLQTLKSHRSILSSLFVLGLIRRHVYLEFLPDRLMFNIPITQTHNFIFYY